MTLQQLQNYVYALKDPFNGSIFYVGKASFNNRAFNHLQVAPDEREKGRRIEAIRKQGAEPVVDIIRSGLDEKSVYEVEAAVIDSIGLENLTNVIRGHGVERGRLTALSAERLYGARPVELSEYAEPVLLIFINQTYSPSMDEIELYDSVRQYWNVGPKAREIDPATGELKYKIAVGVADSVAVAVYSVAAWFPAGTTVSTRGIYDGDGARSKKWEFVGQQLHEHPLAQRRLQLQGADVRAVQNGFTYFPA
ncbi:LEM-3-like GIY-YIG domain-containing protein [Kerstersia similis]|uniref:LEM-3-like GIY-YIG domain-containing protein n=1 Tax=Kerstersia similis TaxID=206505 RepID=UPI0039F074DD